MFNSIDNEFFIKFYIFENPRAKKLVKKRKVTTESIGRWFYICLADLFDDF